MRQAPVLALGAVAGLALAYIDSLPTWDDAGIIAGGLLLIAALLTLLGYRRPWLVALAVGLWIPLRGLVTSHDPRILLVLLFPLAGAYLGWATRLGLSRALHRT